MYFSLQLDVAEVTAVDWVESIVEAQKQRAKWRDLDSKIHNMCFDLSEKQLEAGAYDLVVEKAMLDSIISHPDAKDLLPKILRNFSQCLRDGGHFVCVSSAIGIDRVALFDRKDCQWKTLHLSEICSDKDQEVKINLIIVRKLSKQEWDALPAQGASSSSNNAPSH